MGNPKYFFASILTISIHFVFGQSPTDALMMKKNQLCIASVGSLSKWSQYWEGDYLRKNGNVGTLTSRQLMIMGGYGLTSKLNLLASLPYQSNEASGGQLAGAKGFQDLSIHLKYQFIDRNKELTRLHAFATASFGTPSTSYNNDYLPLGIGIGANEYGIRAIGYIEYKNTVYGRMMMGYVHRTTTNIEREYHYNNGSQHEYRTINFRVMVRSPNLSS
jgi:hypothetical protein